jgi:hypothetical protein
VLADTRFASLHIPHFDVHHQLARRLPVHNDLKHKEIEQHRQYAQEEIYYIPPDLSQMEVIHRINQCYTVYQPDETVK